MVADGGQEVEAVQAGHHDVAEDEVGGAAREMDASAASPSATASTVVPRQEEAAQVGAHVGIVVDQENARAARTGGRLGLAGGQSESGRPTGERRASLT